MPDDWDTRHSGRSLHQCVLYSIDWARYNLSAWLWCVSGVVKRYGFKAKGSMYF